jgi:hypothetical protein
MATVFEAVRTANLRPKIQWGFKNFTRIELLQTQLLYCPQILHNKFADEERTSDLDFLCSFWYILGRCQ